MGALVEKCRREIKPKTWARLVRRIRTFNPEQEQPEEVFKRLCGDDSNE